MRFSKSRPKTEIEQFNELFRRNNKKYRLEANTKGEILSIETNDTQIKAWLMTKGFTEE